MNCEWHVGFDWNAYGCKNEPGSPSPMFHGKMGEPVWVWIPPLSIGSDPDIHASVIVIAPSPTLKMEID